MTWNAESVVALVCHDCEADLRGAPKVQAGDHFICSACAIRRDQAARRAEALEGKHASA